MSELPPHIQGPFERTNVLGNHVERGEVRCKLCMATAPADSWESEMSHEPGCKYPTEHYLATDGDHVMQTPGASAERIESDTVVTDSDAQPEDEVWQIVRTELEEGH